jgi:hypothetical protein
VGCIESDEVFAFTRILFIYILRKKSALVYLVNYQFFDHLLSLEKSNILETNRHFTPQLLICAVGDVTTSNLAHTARLLDCQHQTILFSINFSLISLCFVLVKVLLVLGCCPLQYVTVRILHTSKAFQGSINLLKTKRNLLYIRNQSVPRSKHFPPRL